MSHQQSRIKAWAQIGLGKVLFKVYQVKTAWANRFGPRPETGDAHGD
jgi:hypothetical protein